MKKIINHIRKVGFAVACLLLSFQGMAQLSISGSNCVVAGGITGFQYTISGSYTGATTLTWTITGGVIAGTGNTTRTGTVGAFGPSIRVVWNQNASSASIQAVTSNPSGSSTKSVTVITIANTVSPSSQLVNYYSSASITGGAPNSTSCTPTYSYWWETSSSSSGPFTTVSGATSQNLTINPVTQKAYYRRVLSFNGGLKYP